jgi:hypothetical protein
VSGALATMISLVSADVVTALAAAGYPPLTPDQSGNAGGILIGPAAAFEQTSPPRIIFEPKGSKFVAAEYYSASATLTTDERRAQSVARTIAGEDISFDVRCWGAANTGVMVDDYDVTRALYHQVRASLQSLMPGAFEIEESGKFVVESNVVRNGVAFVFGVTFLTPVLDALMPYAFANQTQAARTVVVETLHAPAGVLPSGTDHLVLPDGSGSTENGCG